MSVKTRSQIKDMVHIKQPISTAKSSAESVLIHLGHKTNKWKRHGTSEYSISCLNKNCNEQVFFQKTSTTWNGREERQCWRMHFNYDFFEFTVSPLDGRGNTVTQSGTCMIDEEFKTYIKNLPEEFVCERFRCLK